MKPYKVTYRLGDTQSIGDCMNAMLSHFRIDKKIVEQDLKEKWREYVGNIIANRTEKVTIKGEFLYVTLNSAPLKQEIYNNKAKFIQLINTKLGREVIREIIIS